MTGAQASPAVSVIVPVYNRAHSVERALRSVLEQDFSDWECLVVDDGSDDGADLRKVVAGLGDGRFRYMRRENGGGGAARNTGIAAARAPVVAFLDSDDEFLPAKLRLTLARLGGRKNRVVYSQAKVDRGVGRHWVRPDRAIGVDEDAGEYLFVANQFMPTPTLVMSTSLALSVLFDPALRKGQDLDFCLRLAAAGATFDMVEQPLVIWHDEGEAGRASRTGGHAAPTEWVESAGALLTEKARLGYRANVLAYYRAAEEPLGAALDIAKGWAVGGVATRTAARQFLRSFMPRTTYRQLVDGFVRVRGKA